VESALKGPTLNLALCFAFFLGLAVVTQGQAEDYYFYQGPSGELVISNKEPPPGSKIIKQIPGATDKEVPQGSTLADTSGGRLREGLCCAKQAAPGWTLLVRRGRGNAS
jgi:hypothetical protein